MPLCTTGSPFTGPLARAVVSHCALREQAFVPLVANASQIGRRHNKALQTDERRAAVSAHCNWLSRRSRLRGRPLCGTPAREDT